MAKVPRARTGAAPSVFPNARAPRRALTARRLAAGFTQAELARAIGVERTTIWRWETGVADPSPQYRRPLANALSLSVFDLDVLLNEGVA